MGSVTIDVVPYNGALLTVNLNSGPQTIVLGDFGPQTSGVLQDADGTLGPSDDGIATFQGLPLNYVGSGTATPGVFVPGVGIVPLGASVDLVAFEAGGQIYFHYPAGDPNLLGAVALVTDLDLTPYPLFTPVCFEASTVISIPGGTARASDLRPGDTVEDIYGQAHTILWTSHRHVDLSACGPRARAAMAPVRIPITPGIGLPQFSLRLSRNHLILCRHPLAELLFGAEGVLLPAAACVGLTGQIDLTLPRVTYVHIMCTRHVVVRANGLAAETFFPGPQAMAALTPSQRRNFLADPACETAARSMRRAAPVLGMKDARFLISEITTPSTEIFSHEISVH